MTGQSSIRIDKRLDARDKTASDIGVVNDRQLSPTKTRAGSVESPAIAARICGFVLQRSKSKEARSSTRAARPSPSNIRTAHRPVPYKTVRLSRLERVASGADFEAAARTCSDAVASTTSVVSSETTSAN